MAVSHGETALDPRTREELCRRVEELAASYTPEWRFNRESPDIGSVLALVFTGQMADNIRRFNRLPEKYHTEFVNLLGLSPRPPCPAACVAVAEVIRGASSGVPLPRGTPLAADGAGPDGEAVLFETAEDVYLTGARITDILSLSGVRNRILPLLGGPRPAQLIPERAEAPQETGPENAEPFRLFDLSGAGIARSALLMYHRSVFRTKGGAPLQVLPLGPEGASLAEELASSARWRWSYYNGGSLQPFNSAEARDGVLFLRRDGESQPVFLEDGAYHLLCLEALEPVSAAVVLGDLQAASACGGTAPDCVLHDGAALSPEEFMPFGDTVSLFDECYIGSDWVFSQDGASVTLSFELSSRRTLAGLAPRREAGKLRIIRRRREAAEPEISRSAPQQVALEYFNGGWRPIPCADCSALMDGSHTGPVRISFLCPGDWKPLPVDGCGGRCLRLRVLRADGCCLLPCEHTVPVIKNLRLSYEYSRPWRRPQRLRAVFGTQAEDLSRRFAEGRPVTVFRPLPYPPAALYLGFDRLPEGAPISLFFDVEAPPCRRMEETFFEYSGRAGFRPLEAEDNTGNFSCPGTVRFVPPADFAPMEVEGVRRWWLRIQGGASALGGDYPLIRSVAVNAVNILNRQTLEEERFYVESAAPGMSFPLAVENLLCAEVFVNETGQLSRRQIEQMLEESPQDIRISYGAAGEVSTCFVRWTEVDSFAASLPESRHYMLDRIKGAVVFGDGVHVRLPRARHDAAFTVRPVRCGGERGNVPAGAVNRFFRNVMYVESVRNPAAACGGSDPESGESVLRRGAELIGGRGRLITGGDFEQAVRAFSGAVERVRCLAGTDVDGRPDPSRITVALMTRDYARGGQTFGRIREPLKRYLLERCGADAAPECLTVCEPAYVEVSVSVWAGVDDASCAFAARDMLLKQLREALDPLNRQNGWEIGILPSERRLRTLLQALRFPGRIHRICAAARYKDRSGSHETDLDHLPANPFAIAVSGEHRIYIGLRQA